MQVLLHGTLKRDYRKQAVEADLAVAIELRQIHCPGQPRLRTKPLVDARSRNDTVVAVHGYGARCVRHRCRRGGRYRLHGRVPAGGKRSVGQVEDRRPDERKATVDRLDVRQAVGSRSDLVSAGIEQIDVETQGGIVHAVAVDIRHEAIVRRAGAQQAENRGPAGKPDIAEGRGETLGLIAGHRRVARVGQVAPHERNGRCYQNKSELFHLYRPPVRLVICGTSRRLVRPQR